MKSRNKIPSSTMGGNFVDTGGSNLLVKQATPAIASICERLQQPLAKCKSRKQAALEHECTAVVKCCSRLTELTRLALDAKPTAATYQNGLDQCSPDAGLDFTSI